MAMWKSFEIKAAPSVAEEHKADEKSQEENRANKRKNEESGTIFYFISKKTSSPFEEEEKTDLGLVKGHAYGITDVRMIDLNENKWFKIFKQVYFHVIFYYKY